MNHNNQFKDNIYQNLLKLQKVFSHRIKLLKSDDYQVSLN